jgi:hypothetical protein
VMTNAGQSTSSTLTSYMAWYKGHGTTFPTATNGAFGAPSVVNAWGPVPFVALY